MNTFVALLRGINVGGKTIKMAELTKVFEQAGMRDVQTLLASGNVVFTAPHASAPKLQTDLESAISKYFGFRITLQVIDMDTIQSLVKENPFKKLTVSQDFHWYMTFLAGADSIVPTSPSPAYIFVGIHHGALCSILDRKAAKSTDFMTFLDKTYGKLVTTRNWNTIVKIAALQ